MELAEPGKRGVLVLEDGSVFQGIGFGAETEISGEVVFNTSMMGYPELLTDPSYQEQIVVMTYPILGSYGIPPSSIRDRGGVPLHFESDSVKVKGFVVHSLSRPSHWSNHKTLDEWLTEQGVPGIFGIDTRVLTQRLRNKGTMLGVLKVSNSPIDSQVVAGQTSSIQDPNKQDLVQRVSPREPIYYDGSEESTIVIVDCGVKYGILRSLLAKGARVVRVPYDFPADKILKLRIFSDEAGKFNLGAIQVKADFLVISQFTLFAEARGQNRPSFLHAARPEQGRPLLERFIAHLRQSGLRVATGSFGAQMAVELVNDGPVTIVLSTDAWDPRIG